MFCVAGWLSCSGLVHTTINFKAVLCWLVCGFTETPCTVGNQLKMQQTNRVLSIMPIVLDIDLVIVGVVWICGRVHPVSLPTQFLQIQPCI